MTIIYRLWTDKQQNGKSYVYIGQTTRTLAKRKLEHFRAALNNGPEPLHQQMLIIPLKDWHAEVLQECEDANANNQEKLWISHYLETAMHDSSLCVLNATESKSIKNECIAPKPSYGVPKANKQKNYAPGEIGKKLAQVSGKLKPVINLNTNQRYDSLLEAERRDNRTRGSIKSSCDTGKMFNDGTRYAYLDLDNNPKITDGHDKPDFYIMQRAQKIKELTSGIIYKNATEVMKTYNIHHTCVSAYASGKYGVALGRYVFCYLDEDGAEIIKPKHIAALEKIKKIGQIKYVAWPVNFTFDEAKATGEVAYFKSLDDMCQGLKIKSKAHVKSVCDGKRSHAEKWRIAYYNHDTDVPVLTTTHLAKAKKIIRRIQCLDDGKAFDNCTEAGSAYSVAHNQIGMCARGILKSVRVKNKETGTTERLRFAYLDANDQPILTARHSEPLSQRKGVAKIVLLNPEMGKSLGKSIFSSRAEFCRETGVPRKALVKYLQDNTRNLLGYECKELA